MQLPHLLSSLSFAVTASFGCIGIVTNYVTMHPKEFKIFKNNYKFIPLPKEFNFFHTSSPPTKRKILILKF